MDKGFTMVGDKDPFGYSLITYVWVVGLACIGGAVKYLNSAARFSFASLARDVVTSGFTGLITFWLCEWTNTQGPLMAVMIAVTGLMGNRAWKEFENIVRARLGISGDKPASEADKAPSSPTGNEPTKVE